jgi:hypothetical protein
MLIIHRNVLVGLARLSELEVGGRPAFSMVLTACLMTPSRYNTFVPCTHPAVNCSIILGTYALKRRTVTGVPRAVFL